MFYLIPLLTAFLLTLILTPGLQKFALKLNIVDKPSLRKVHLKPTPLLGGIALFLAFSLTTIIFWSTGYIEDAKISNLNILAILIGGAVLMVGGFLDDKYKLNPWQQIVFPILAVLIVLGSGIKIQFVTNPWGGVFEFTIFLGLIVAFIWLMGMTYTTKLLDGLDGLLAGVTVIGSIIIFIVSLFWDVPLSGTSILALILAGSALGFLIFNWHPAKIFMGEGGSLFCGFMLGVLAIISGSKIATALLIMGIPILDVLWVIIRRIWQGKSVTQADRKHLHFRLLDLGLSHRQTVIFLYFLTAVFGISSLFLHSAGKIIALGILLIFMIILVASLVLFYKTKQNGSTFKK